MRAFSFNFWNASQPVRTVSSLLSQFLALSYKTAVCDFVGSSVKQGGSCTPTPGCHIKRVTSSYLPAQSSSEQLRISFVGAAPRWLLQPVPELLNRVSFALGSSPKLPKLLSMLGRSRQQKSEQMTHLAFSRNVWCLLSARMAGWCGVFRSSRL